MSKENSIFKGDRYLWGIYFMLCIISIIEIYSSSSYLTRYGGNFLRPAMRQIGLVIFGTALVVGMHNVHYKWSKVLMLLLTLGTPPLLIGAFFLGRWLDFGFSVQPSELAKLWVILLLAFILAKYQDPERHGAGTKAFKYCLIITGVTCLLIVKDNLSTALLVGVVSFSMMIIAKVEGKKLLLLAAIVMAAVVVLLSLSVVVYKYEEAEKKKSEKTEKKTFQALSKTRMTTWGGRCARFFENSDKKAYEEAIVDDNYQEQHAYMAVANSKGIGVWPGNSRARDFLPEAYSDFIYAIIIEETGILGGIFVMALYISLLLRAGAIARRCDKAYPAFLITGLATMIAFQALINMGVSVGLFPVTGQPLPLVSRGGSSFMVISAYFGIMLSISRFAKQTGSEEDAGTPMEEDNDISAPNPIQKIDEYDESTD